jgi:hypothetical protein
LCYPTETRRKRILLSLRLCLCCHACYICRIFRSQTNMSCSLCQKQQTSSGVQYMYVLKPCHNEYTVQDRDKHLCFKNFKLIIVELTSGIYKAEHVIDETPTKQTNQRHQSKEHRWKRSCSVQWRPHVDRIMMCWVIRYISKINLELNKDWKLNKFELLFDIIECRTVKSRVINQGANKRYQSNAHQRTSNCDKKYQRPKTTVIQTN